MRRCPLLSCDVRCPEVADCYGCRIDMEERIAIKQDSRIANAEEQARGELRAKAEVRIAVQERLAL